MQRYLLNIDRIKEEIARLSDRISERFPDSGLSHVCEELVQVSRLTKQQVEWVNRPIIALRVSAYLLIGIIISGVLSVALSAELSTGKLNFVEFVGFLEAGINDLVLIGAGLFFVLSLEARIKRARALKFLHELRSLAHVIDMHQLTKDPERLLSRVPDTESSPKNRIKNSLELGRYLDYCSEMLSLISKLAALYAQNFNDPVALNSVNEIENMTTGLSRKIWQKLMILHMSPHM